MVIPNQARKILKWVLIGVLVALIVTKAFFIGFYQIPQNGMYPSLPAGSRIFTSKRAYSQASKVQRGDIIVFVHEENGQRYNYIWRVVALPGERVEASGEALMIDGQPVRREHLRESGNMTIYREQASPIQYEVAFDSAARQRPPDTSVTVPPEHFFVMGDNRFNAVDSRYFGPISFTSILGRKL